MKKTLLVLVTIFSTSSAWAGDLNLQSAFPLGLPVVGPGADRFVESVELLTAGEIRIKHHGAGVISPPSEILEYVGKGKIAAGWSYAGFESSKVPAAALFGSIPFGPDAAKYISWLHYGGGIELWRELYKPFNVVPMPCAVIISEAGGWFTKPINHPADLNGLNIRIGGLGGKILGKLGANAVFLPVNEVAASLDSGKLDATELGFPMVDRLLGFDKVAKHYYFPGWHQPSGFIELYFNTDVWNSLTDQQRRSVETACSDVILWSIGIASAGQQDALNEFRSNGVDIKRFPESVINELRKAADEVYAESSADDPMFKKIHDSYAAYSIRYDEYKALSKID